VFISVRKSDVFGQKVDMWHRNWNFISLWSVQPFKQAYFWELFLNVMKT